MKNIRIGIFGAGRGMEIATDLKLLKGCEVVALCDGHKERREAAVAKLPESVAVYERFEDFIEHDMDAVILANTFHRHAPFAIECFKRNLHVFCECLSNGTMAEGVELIRAFEKSKSIFMLAENYPQRRPCREIKRICDGGSLGKFLYAEGEYNHPASPRDVGFNKRFIYFENHWRNYLPRTYYITHSLGPLMWATGATPKRVTAMAAFAPNDPDFSYANHCGDRTAIIMTQNDDGSVYRLTGCSAFGSHFTGYRVCGTKGQIENSIGQGWKVTLSYNSWEKPEGAENVSCYLPDWNDEDEELLVKSGHGGADYLTDRMFLDCVRENKQPEHPFDIYSAVNMSSVAILSHRSVLNGSIPYDIPDFHTEEARRQYENDRLSPFPGDDGSAPTLPCCSHPDYAPSEEQIRRYLEILK